MQIDSSTTVFLGLLAVMSDTAAVALNPTSSHTKKQIATESFEALRVVSQQLMAGTVTPLEALNGFGEGLADVSSKWADKMDAGLLTLDEEKDCAQFFVSGLSCLAQIEMHVAIRQTLEAKQAKAQAAAGLN